MILNKMQTIFKMFLTIREQSENNWRTIAEQSENNQKRNVEEEEKYPFQ